MNRRFALLLLYLCLIIGLMVWRNELMEWMGREGSLGRWLAVWGAAVLVVFVPLFPFGAVASLLAMQWGAPVGIAISLTASVTGSVLMFLYFRYTFGPSSRQFLMRYRYIGWFTERFEQRQFVSLLLVRLIPVIPSQAVNLFCSAAAIRLGPYAAASLIGKAPMLIVFSIAGEQLTEQPKAALLILVLYAVTLAVLVWIVMGHQRSYTEQQIEEPHS